ncbi:unnamed protein product [Pleuronectes platessa]|uniref:Uncharacterized protein n=1 Tax=Pleuronectes platessa TaxID=8262 RepID=A0A9N7UQF4_PLEPL|nr:unnamed protein product [Pleuronectes platessa]
MLDGMIHYHSKGLSLRPPHTRRWNQNTDTILAVSLDPSSSHTGPSPALIHYLTRRTPIEQRGGTGKERSNENSEEEKKKTHTEGSLRVENDAAEGETERKGKEEREVCEKADDVPPLQDEEEEELYTWKTLTQTSAWRFMSFPVIRGDITSCCVTRMMRRRLENLLLCSSYLKSKLWTKSLDHKLMNKLPAEGILPEALMFGLIPDVVSCSFAHTKDTLKDFHIWSTTQNLSFLHIDPSMINGRMVLH